MFFGNLLICVSYHRKHRLERHLNIVTYQPSGMVSTVIDSIVAREVKVSLIFISLPSFADSDFYS